MRVQQVVQEQFKFFCLFSYSLSRSHVGWQLHWTRGDWNWASDREGLSSDCVNEGKKFLPVKDTTIWEFINYCSLAWLVRDKDPQRKKCSTDLLIRWNPQECRSLLTKEKWSGRELVFEHTIATAKSFVLGNTRMLAQTAILTAKITLCQTEAHLSKISFGICADISYASFTCRSTYL